jgi:ankyrin repeat protein
MNTLTTTPAEEQRYAELQMQALDCARTGDLETLRLMLQAGMPVNLVDHKSNSLLMLAAYHEEAAIVRLLLDQGAAVDQRNDRQQTPLGGVAFKGYAEIARLLIQAGADINADNGNGMTPLMFARMFGRSEVAQILAEAGAKTGQGWFKAVWLRIVGRLARGMMWALHVGKTDRAARGAATI